MNVWQEKFLKVDEIAVMEDAFRDRFKDFLKEYEDVEFEGFYTNNSFYLTTILRNSDSSFYYPFETSLSRADNPDITEIEAKNILLDFIEEYFEEYFSNNREVYIPIDWLAYKFRDIKVYARAQVINKRLEELGNNLLKNGAYDFNNSDK